MNPYYEEYLKTHATSEELRKILGPSWRDLPKDSAKPGTIHALYHLSKAAIRARQDKLA